MSSSYFFYEYWTGSQASGTPGVLASTVGAKKGLHPADIVIFVLVLAVSLGIGIYFALAGGRQKTTREFLMGNRSLSMIPVSISVFMSFISAILVLGNTAEVYLHGTRIFISCFGGGLAFLFTAFFFLPLFYPLKLTSSFEVS